MEVVKSENAHYKGHIYSHTCVVCSWLVCQHDEVTEPISTVIAWRIKCTWMSAIVLSFHWRHEKPAGVAHRAAIVWLENLKQTPHFAL